MNKLTAYRSRQSFWFSLKIVRTDIIIYAPVNGPTKNAEKMQCTLLAHIFFKMKGNLFKIISHAQRNRIHRMKMNVAFATFTFDIQRVTWITKINVIWNSEHIILIHFNILRSPASIFWIFVNDWHLGQHGIFENFRFSELGLLMWSKISNRKL